MASLVQGILGAVGDDVTVTFDSRLGGSSFSLHQEPGADPNPLAAWFAPSVTVEVGGAQVASAAPYGKPDSSLAGFYLLLGGALVLGVPFFLGIALGKKL